MIQSVVRRLGYPAVFVGTLLEGETFILLGGFLAHRGYLGLGRVISLATLGAFTGDILYFVLGRHFGRAMLERSRRAAEALPWLERFMTRYRILWVFGARYLYGVRWLAAGLAGSSKMGLLRFSSLTLPACLLWAVVVGFLGYGAGEGLESVLGDLKRYEVYLLLALLVAGIVYGTLTYGRERRLGRKIQQAG